MCVKTCFLQIAVILFMVTLLSAASTTNPPDKSRHKRTIQYFFNGLLGVLTNGNSLLNLIGGPARNPNNGRLAAYERQTSPLATLAKLSSFSTQARMVDLTDDDDEHDKSDNEVVTKPPFLIQFPLPALKPTRTQTTKSPMTKRMQVETPNNQVNKNETRELQMKTGFVQRNNDSMQMIDSSTMGKIDLQTFTMAPSPMTPNATESRESIQSTDLTDSTKLTETTESFESINPTESIESTTNEPEMNTEETELTTLDPIMSDTTNISASTQINATEMQDDMERRIDLGKIPDKLSKLHTTQFFGGPMVVERHHDDQHIPIYTDNCIDENCKENDSNEILPYIRPAAGARGIPIISMSIALPTSNGGERSKNGQHYNIFTLHSVPIFHSFLSRPLTDKIRDVPATPH